MIRRTTIELDDDLLRRAMRALGTGTKRATVEEALRRVSDAAEPGDTRRRRRAVPLLKEISELERAQGISREEKWR